MEKESGSYYSGFGVRSLHSCTGLPSRSLRGGALAHRVTSVDSRKPESNYKMQRCAFQITYAMKVIETPEPQNLNT